MSEEKNSKFYEPILSAAGVIASLVTALSPLFPSNPAGQLFLVEKFSKPSSLVAFVLSLGMIWAGGTFSPHFNWLIPKENLNIRRLFSRWVNVPPSQGFIHFSTQHVAIVLVLIATGLFFEFIKLSELADQKYGSLQSIVYILFFLVISYLFSLLLNYTKQTYEYGEKKREFPKAIQNLLENYGFLNTGIVVEENNQLSKQELSSYGVEQFSGRHIKIKTKPQPELEKEFIISSDGQELYKEL